MSIAFAAAAGGGSFAGSPFSLIVHPAKASADNTEMPAELMAGLKTAVGESGSFIVQAADQFKNLCTRGGDRIKVGAHGALTAHCEDLGTGQYRVSYQCDESGVHKMALTVGETHIKGSPLAVTCEPGPIHVPSCELLHSGATSQA